MNIAIVLSGGVGSRMGLDIPKQYVVVNNKPIIEYSLRKLIYNKNIDAMVICVAKEWIDFVKGVVFNCRSKKNIYFAESGETRQYSVYNALKKMREIGFSADDIVLIHDAARPLLSEELIDRCLSECRNCDGVIPVIPVKDTVYMSKDGKSIHSLLNRSELWNGQSPEAFVFGKYLEIHDRSSRDLLLSINGSTEIAFIAGLNCHMVMGDPLNFKITTKEDLSNFESIIKIDESFYSKRCK